MNLNGLLGRPTFGHRLAFGRGIFCKGRSQPAQWNGEILKQSCVLMIHGPGHMGLLHNPLGDDQFSDGMRTAKLLLVGKLELSLEASRPSREVPRQRRDGVVSQPNFHERRARGGLAVRRRLGRRPVGAAGVHAGREGVQGSPREMRRRLSPQAQPGSGAGMTLWLLSMAVFIASSLLAALNYIVTVINLRTKGMTMTRLPLTIWAFLVTAIIGVISFPVLLSAALLLIMDRSFGTSFFLSDIFIQGEVLHYQGGSPVLFEHLFWFLGHPEVYIVLLPALGIASEVIATNSRKPIFGYRAMVASILAIAFLSTIVWGHHMFVTGMNPFLGSVFTFTTLLLSLIHI